WRINKPRGRFIGYSSAHVKPEGYVSCRTSEILDPNQLGHGAALRGHESFCCDLQAFGSSLAHETVRIPLVRESVSAGRIRQQDLSIQKKFAGDQKTRAPGRVRNSAACERWNRQGCES